jgi:NAD(P)-dependent dehydrogenase (short-subunit alcohol dehydrogenase family)
MNILQDKVAVITGGASGIGEAAARRFVSEGARVVIADLQDRKGEALARSLGDCSVFVKTDVTSENDMRRLVEFALDHFGRLDCFYNNAGFGCANLSITEIPLEDFESQMAVLLRATFLGIKHAGAVMKRLRSGTIINTSSVAGITGGYANHVYSAAKAGVISLTRSSALELGEAGVRVNCICPGSIATPIFVRGIQLSEDEVNQAVKTVAAFMQNNPLGRSGLPEEIANAAVWLASEGSSYINGQALVVDGGLTSGVPWSHQQAWAKALYDELGQRFPRAFAELART